MHKQMDTHKAILVTLSNSLYIKLIVIQYRKYYMLTTVQYN